MLGLAVGLDLDPDDLRVDQPRQDELVRHQLQRRSSNTSVDNQIDAVQKLPLDKQAAAWNAMDKSIMAKYFPLFPTYYGGVAQAHGSQDPG